MNYEQQKIIIYVNLYRQIPTNKKPFPKTTNQYLTINNHLPISMYHTTPTYDGISYVTAGNFAITIHRRTAHVDY
jgi:hypothetical protein